MKEKYGSFHSKMAILFFQRGVRIIVTTANFIPKDFDTRVNSVFVQDFPLKGGVGEVSMRVGDVGEVSMREEDRSNNNRDDFCDYLSGYLDRIIGHCTTSGDTLLRRVIGRLPSYNFSGADARLVASCPGDHVNEDTKRWGIGRLQELLSQQYIHPPEPDEEDVLVMQVSSISSMRDNACLVDEYAKHMMTTAPPKCRCGQQASKLYKKVGLFKGGEPFFCCALTKCMFHQWYERYERYEIEVVWPTVDCVRWSPEGWSSGGAIPAHRKHVFDDNKNGGVTYKAGFKGRFCQWDGAVAGRAMMTPHNKCYLRYRRPKGWTSRAGLEEQEQGQGEQKIEFLFLTSSNLSQAAHGVYTVRT
jgi:hypothetical protein